jgi:hypothetical protein
MPVAFLLLRLVVSVVSIAAEPQSDPGTEGLYLFAQRRYEQAAPLLEKASAAAPDQPELARALGFVTSVYRTPTAPVALSGAYSG